MAARMVLGWSDAGESQSKQMSGLYPENVNSKA